MKLAQMITERGGPWDASFSASSTKRQILGEITVQSCGSQGRKNSAGVWKERYVSAKPRAERERQARIILGQAKRNRNLRQLLCRPQPPTPKNPVALHLRANETCCTKPSREKRFDGDCAIVGGGDDGARRKPSQPRRSAEQTPNNFNRIKRKEAGSMNYLLESVSNRTNADYSITRASLKGPHSSAIAKGDFVSSCPSPATQYRRPTRDQGGRVSS